MTRQQNSVRADLAGRTMDGLTRCHEASLTQRDGSLHSLPELGPGGATVVYSFGVVGVIVPPSIQRERTLSDRA
jgi:hypothetical protein